MGFRNRVLSCLEDIEKHAKEALEHAGDRGDRDFDEVVRLLLDIQTDVNTALGELYESCGPFIRKNDA